MNVTDKSPPKPESGPGSGSDTGPAPARAARPIPRAILGALQRLLLPAVCLCCGRALGAGRHPLGLCLACRGRLKRPAPGCAVCGRPLPAARLRPLAPGFACHRCRARPPAFDRLIAAWSYEGPVEAVITGLKYRRLDYLGGHLARSLVEPLTTSSPTDSRPGPWDLVVPVPLHWRRRWGRGFNQAERIARPLARHLGLPCHELLRRTRATRPQARLSRTERLENPAGAFAVRRGPGGVERLSGRRVLLVDDVATTGATLAAAAAALGRAGAVGVTVAVAARTPED